MMFDTYHNILVFASSITPSRPWGVNIPNYFWAGGISVGAFFIYSLYTVFGIENFKKLSSMCLLIAFSFIAIAPLNLIDDLKQPGRMIHIMLYGWSHFPTSPMKWGVILLTSYTIFALLSLIAYYRPYFVKLHNSIENDKIKLVFKLLTLNRMGLNQETITKDKKILFYLGVLGLIFGIGVEFYTGYIVGILVSFPLVHYPALPLVMLTSALVSGSGFVLFFYPIYQAIMSKDIDRDDISSVAIIMAWAIVAELILDLFWYSFGLAFNGITKYYMRAYFKEDLFKIIVFDLGLFLFVPMILGFSKLRKSAFFMFIAGILAAFGAWYFKYSLVIGGQSFPKMTGGFLTYTMPIFGHNSLQSLIANWGGIIGLLALTIAILPHSEDIIKDFTKGVK